jgi:hypothetical protein
MLEQFAVVPSSDRATLQLATTDPSVIRPYCIRENDSLQELYVVYICVLWATRTTNIQCRPPVHVVTLFKTTTLFGPR